MAQEVQSLVDGAEFNGRIVICSQVDQQNFEPLQF